MAALSPQEIRQCFLALPLPLQNIHAARARQSHQLPPAVEQEFSARRATSLIRETGGLLQMSLPMIGDLTCLVGRVTPLQLDLEPDPRLAVQLAYSGRAVYALDHRSLHLATGECVMYIQQASTLRIGFGSGIGFQLQPARLLRTLKAISGDQDLRLSADGLQAHLDQRCSAALYSLFRLVDRLLLEDPVLPQCLGLDEQLYRLIALRLLQRRGRLTAETAPRPRSMAASPERVLERLVDSIGSRLTSPLTLTDLERRSGYSARRLQQLFRERFDCSPMEYVRRQRLALARQRLEEASPGDTVTAVARSIGYRRVDHFSRDFRRQFGCSPSALLGSAGASPAQDPDAPRPIARDAVAGQPCFSRPRCGAAD